MRLLDLQSWFDQNQRSLPWRKPSPDPYEIWISEVMSQQSVLVTVQKYFVNWMKRFPTLHVLSKSSEEQVLAQWAGLGYYSRARLVHKAAKYLSQQSQLPRDVEQWRQVPGVGPYTAKAVSAIAFSEPVIPVDGNVIRVVSRFFGIADPLNNRTDMQDLLAEVEKLERQLSSDRRLSPSSVAQGFMDLGATVCRPRELAICEVCPFSSGGCVAYKTQKVGALPAPKARKKTVFLDFVADLRFNSKGQLWVEPADEHLPGKLINQWQIPLVKIDSKSSFWGQKPRVTHSITHHRFRIRMPDDHPGSKGLLGLKRKVKGVWVSLDAPKLHLTTLSRKILKASGLQVAKDN